MHSTKIMKVLAAGLTTATLTFGAVAPALAEVKIGDVTQDESVLDSKDDSIVVTVAISDYENDYSDEYPCFALKRATFKVVDSKGNQGKKTFVSDESMVVKYYNSDGFEAEDNSEDITSASFEITFDEGMTNGTYTLSSILFADGEGTKSVSNDDVSFTVKNATKSTYGKVAAKLSSLELGKKTFNADTQKGAGDLTVSIDVASDSPIVEGEAYPQVIFKYKSPSGESNNVKATPVESAAQGEYAECKSGSMAGFATETGVYKLVKITVTAEDGSYVEYTTGLEEGNFTVVEGSADWVLRLYNRNSGEHVYTKSAGEKDNLVDAGWRFEGVAFGTLGEDDEDSVEVYRAYNPNGGDHHYTTSVGEIGLLVKEGWKNEGVAFYGYGEKKLQSLDQDWLEDHNQRVYRLYNPNAKIGAHHYTTSADEKELLVKAGWKDEGTGWFAPVVEE